MMMTVTATAAAREWEEGLGFGLGASADVDVGSRVAALVRAGGSAAWHWLGPNAVTATPRRGRRGGGVGGGAATCSFKGAWGLDRGGLGRGSGALDPGLRRCGGERQRLVGLAAGGEKEGFTS